MGWEDTFLLKAVPSIIFLHEGIYNLLSLIILTSYLISICLKCWIADLIALRNLNKLDVSFNEYNGTLPMQGKCSINEDERARENPSAYINSEFRKFSLLFFFFQWNRIES